MNPPSFQQLCTPAKIYIVLAMISLFFALLNNTNFYIILFKLFFILLWTCLLNYFCDNGMTTLSWILVLLPFIIVISAFIFMISFGTMKKKKN